MCACRECYHYRERVLFKGTEIISKAIRYSRDGKQGQYYLARIPRKMVYFN